MNWLSSIFFSPTAPTTCSTSYGQFLLSLSPALCALLSAIALWVGARARVISQDALLTSQATASLSLLATDSRHATADPDPPQDRERR